MELQSVCLGFSAPKARIPNPRVSIVFARDVWFSNQRLRFGTSPKSNLVPGFKRLEKNALLPNLKRGVIVSSSNSSSDSKLGHLGQRNSGVPVIKLDVEEPFRGKSGSVSFYGLTDQAVEEGKLVSAPFNEDKGSFLWILAPVALISSTILPQFFLGSAIQAFLKEDTLVEIVSSLVFEVLFYIGLATFLLVTDHVQRPYLQFSTKRWGLITGLRGYLTSSFFATGFKVIAPLFAMLVTWPVIGLPALVAVAPFLFSCAAQLAFEMYLDKRGSSCWPLVPIVFEVYRLYLLTRAAHFIEKLMFSMKELPVTPKVMERSGAMFAMVVTFQVLGVVCLWSLMTFLLRLFPSRPVAEKY